MRFAKPHGSHKVPLGKGWSLPRLFSHRTRQERTIVGGGSVPRSAQRCQASRAMHSAAGSCSLRKITQFFPCGLTPSRHGRRQARLVSTPSRTCGLSWRMTWVVLGALIRVWPEKPGDPQRHNLFGPIRRTEARVHRVTKRPPRGSSTNSSRA
jgi:hypothetical protein